MYFLPVILSFLFTFFKRAPFLFLFFLLAIFAGSRGVGVDLDYINYYNLWFKSYALSDWFVEPFSKFIFFIIYKAGLPFNFSLLVFSLATMFFLYKSCSRLKVDKAVFILMYVGYFYYIHVFMQIRMGLALSIFIYALTFVGESKFKVYSLMIISVLFHQSLALLLLFYIILFSYTSYVLLIYLFILSCFFWVTAILQVDILSFTLKFFAENLDIEKISFYYQQYLLAGDKYRANVFNVISVLNFIISFFCIFQMNKVKDDNQVRFNLFLFLSMYTVIGFMFFSLFSFFSSVSYRIYEMFYFFMPFVVSYVYRHVSFNKRVGIVLYLFIYSCVCVYQNTVGHSVISSYKLFF